MTLALFLATTVLATALASIAVWSPRKVRTKLAAIAITAAFLPLSYASITQLLARPKPVALDWHADLGDAEVLSFMLQEGKAIYLWLQVPDVDEPRYFSLPWNQALGEQLHRARREGAARGTAVRVQGLADASREMPLAYAAPRPALPPKAGERMLENTLDTNGDAAVPAFGGGGTVIEGRDANAPAYSQWHAD